MNKRTFLLFGYGSIGKTHARILRAMGHGVTTIDPDPETGAMFSSYDTCLWGARHYDGILDCTPPDVRVTWDILTPQPKFIEKPLGQMPPIEFDLPVFLGFNFRWHHRLEQFVRGVQERGVSSLVVAGGQHIQDWHTEDYRAVRRRYHGVVTDSLPHSIYIARWILGDVTYCGSTTAKVSDLDIEVEDTAGVLLAGPNGEPALLVADYLREMHTFHIDAVTKDGGTYPWEFAPKEAEAMYFRQMDKFVALCEGRLDGGYPSLKDGLKVQEILDAISQV